MINTFRIHFEFAYFSFFLTHLELKRSRRSYSPVVPSKSKPYPIPDQNGQSVYPFSDQNGAKTLPDGAAHTDITYVREYPPPPGCKRKIYKRPLSNELHGMQAKGSPGIIYFFV